MVGNLQGNFDLVWKTVAQYFRNDPWVVGYDPYNEPFSTETQTASESTFTGQLSASTAARRTRAFWPMVRVRSSVRPECPTTA